MSNRYTYRAEWSPEDGEYVGLVAEFPSLSWLAPTAGEAISGAERLVDEILIDMASAGEVPPVPFAERRYSGNISFRTSPDQHRRLAVEAAEQGVSINQWMVQKLAARPQAEVEHKIGPTGAAFHRLAEHTRGSMPASTFGFLVDTPIIFGRANFRKSGDPEPHKCHKCAAADHEDAAEDKSSEDKSFARWAAELGGAF